MSKEQVELLLKAVEGQPRLLILTHNDPDPDAVASALALQCLLTTRLHLTVELAYHGIIGRAENKALVSYLGEPLQPLAGLDFDSSTPFALVDTQPGSGNNALPAGVSIAIVVDHHPWREATALATFADVRTAVGSTSTILTEYLLAAQLEPDRSLATALFYGIKSDTMGLSRKAHPSDVAAYTYLQPRADVDALMEIERAQVPLGYFKSFDTALRAARLYDDRIIISYIGPMAYPDLSAELADVFMRLEGSEWVICMGLYQDELILAVRTRHRDGGAGQLAQTVVDGNGEAGGHGVMAGGHIYLNGRDPKRLATRLSQRVLRYLKAENTRSQALI